MSLRDTIHGDLVVAMKARQDIEKSALRLLLSALSEAEKVDGKALDMADEHRVITKKLKETQRAIDEYRRLGQPERVQALEEEHRIYQRYAPQPLGRDELIELIDGTIRDAGAKTINDFGRVMPAVMSKIAGRADGSRVRLLVQERLSARAA